MVINRVFTVKLTHSVSKLDLFNYIAQSLILSTCYAWNLCLPGKVSHIEQNFLYFFSENMHETFVIHGKVLRIIHSSDLLCR